MKTLLINGSPHEHGNTYTALQYVADSLEEEGLETEIFHISPESMRGCIACMACQERGYNRCAFDDGAVNTILEKMENMDALVVGSPTYYASASGQLISTLDRVFYAGGALFAGKPGGIVCVARRGGATSAMDVLQKYLTISGMPIAPSTYWPIIYGRKPGEVELDAEGIQEMQMLGKTIAWMLKCFDAGRAAGIEYPQTPGGKKIMTHFIR